MKKYCESGRNTSIDNNKWKKILPSLCRIYGAVSALHSSSRGRELWF